MTALEIVLMVLGILALVAAINLAIWIPIIRKLRRMPDQLREELAGERIERGPERANYRGASAEFTSVKGIGVMALTDRRIVFRKAIGAPVDIPRARIKSVREELWFLKSAVGGKRHLVVTLDDGTEVGYFVKDNAAWLAALRN